MSKVARGPKGTAFNEAVFTGSRIALAGGPVRIATASIDRNSSRASVYAAALARGWRVIEAGSVWLLVDARLTFAEVIMGSRTLVLKSVP